MCKYCDSSRYGGESIYYNKDSEDLREIVIELDGTLSIISNNFDEKEYKKWSKFGFSIPEAKYMAEYTYNIKINYCPFCGRKLRMTNGRYLRRNAEQRQDGVAEQNRSDGRSHQRGKRLHGSGTSRRLGLLKGYDKWV